MPGATPEGSDLGKYVLQIDVRRWGSLVFSDSGDPKSVESLFDVTQAKENDSG